MQNLHYLIMKDLKLIFEQRYLAFALSDRIILFQEHHIIYILDSQLGDFSILFCYQIQQEPNEVRKH